MGETVDALVVGASWHVLRLGDSVNQANFIKPETMDRGSVVEVYRPLYARCSMIGTHHRQMKKPQSKRSWCFFIDDDPSSPQIQHLCPHRFWPQLRRLCLGTQLTLEGMVNEKPSRIPGHF